LPLAPEEVNLTRKGQRNPESISSIWFGSDKQALTRQHRDADLRQHRRHYVQFGADLASVLATAQAARLPLSAAGPLKASPPDILFSSRRRSGKSWRADTLDYLERKGFAKDINKQFHLCDQLYQRRRCTSSRRGRSTILKETGWPRTLASTFRNCGTFVTEALTVGFERLG